MRKARVYPKHYKPDSKYDRVDVGRFINVVMKDGKKSVAESVVYGAFDIVQKKTKEDPIAVFEKAIENVVPSLEVISRRVGGANYQIPHEVRPERQFALAVRWIIKAAQDRTGSSMDKRLADEFITASKGEGTAVKRKQDMHRMAEANRAFAHFARKRKKKV